MILPIPYAIPDEYILDNPPEKKQIFSTVAPGKNVFGIGQESEYYKEYRDSRFANTSKKGGWDCLRHYEILASGCIPVFKDLESCPKDTMISFPKELVMEACEKLLPWKEEYAEMYNSYVEKLLHHCRTYCSTSALTKYFLEKVNNPQKILMILGHRGVNYTREFLSISLRRHFGNNFIEYPRNSYLYKGAELSNAHGNGYGYSEKFSVDDCNRSNIQERIINKEFDLIIYGKVGRDEFHEGSYPNLQFIKEVQTSYSPSEIVFLYGGDGLQDLNTKNSYTNHLLDHSKLGICFVRELALETLL